jgi:hypothetical protein
LTSEEVNALRWIDEKTEDVPWLVISRTKKAPKSGEAMSTYDRLAAKGCAVIGTLCTGVVWVGASAPELKKDPEFAIKLTDRGRARLTMLDVKGSNNAAS